MKQFEDIKGFFVIMAGAVCLAAVIASSYSDGKADALALQEAERIGYNKALKEQADREARAAEAAAEHQYRILHESETVRGDAEVAK